MCYTRRFKYSLGAILVQDLVYIYIYMGPQYFMSASVFDDKYVSYLTPQAAQTPNTYVKLQAKLSAKESKYLSNNSK